MIADAHACQGAQTDAASLLCDGALGTPVIAGARARILPSGEAEAPANAPAVVQAMIAAGDRIDHFPYSYGGAHGDPAQTMNPTNPDPAAVPGDEENGGPGVRLLLGDVIRPVGRAAGAEPGGRRGDGFDRARERGGPGAGG